MFQSLSFVSKVSILFLSIGQLSLLDRDCLASMHLDGTEYLADCRKRVGLIVRQQEETMMSQSRRLTAGVQPGCPEQGEEVERP